MTFVPKRSAKSSPGAALRPAARAARSLVGAALALMLGTGTGLAQQATIPRDNEPFYAEPGGVRLGRLAQGASFRTGATRAGHVEVTVEGWMFAASLQASNRPTYDLAVGPDGGENLRATPNGRIVARLLQGALVDQVERQGAWVRVRRVAWVGAEALRAEPPVTASSVRPGAAPAARPAPASARRPDTAGAGPGQVVTVDTRRAVVRRRSQLHRSPGESPAGTLDAGTPVRVTARAGAWVRVEAQGWVRDSEIRLADSSILTGVSAAELRGAPDEFRGRLLRWTIQFIALQIADELRSDFPPGERYILARGPAPEYAFVYILVPRDKVAAVQRLEPLASVDVVARVVSGRSAYLSNPILELVDITQ
jgi:hypothetical protein